MQTVFTVEPGRVEVIEIPEPYFGPSSCLCRFCGPDLHAVRRGKVAAGETALTLGAG